MVIIELDVHKNLCQLSAVCEETGEVILEMPVETTADALRRVVTGIQGDKKVVFEEGPMSALIQDALKDCQGSVKIVRSGSGQNVEGLILSA